MDVSVEGLYRRMVVERQGSYCFGLNILFLQMMRGLGYRYVHIISSPRYLVGWQPQSHMYSVNDQRSILLVHTLDPAEST